MFDLFLNEMCSVIFCFDFVCRLLMWFKFELFKFVLIDLVFRVLDEVFVLKLYILFRWWLVLFLLIINCWIDFCFNFVGEIDLLCVLFFLGVFGVVGVVLILLSEEKWWGLCFLLMLGLIGVNFVCMLVFFKDFREYFIVGFIFIEFWEFSF